MSCPLRRAQTITCASAMSLVERALAEMIRVTKPNGTLVFVDYAPPKSATERVLSGMIALYERDHYSEFMRCDLGAQLSRTGVRVEEERRKVLGGGAHPVRQEGRRGGTRCHAESITPGPASPRNASPSLARTQGARDRHPCPCPN